MIWGQFFSDLLVKFFDFIDGITLFFGISLWDLVLIFFGLWDLSLIIAALFKTDADKGGESA